MTARMLQPLRDRGSDPLKDAAYQRAHELDVHRGHPVRQCPDCQVEEAALAGRRWAA
jgi:hypothetical protein